MLWTKTEGTICAPEASHAIVCTIDEAEKAKQEGKDMRLFNKQENIFGACSAVALFKKTMLERIKDPTDYFDERLFFLVEDVDLAWRAQKNGYKAIFCPDAIC